MANGKEEKNASDDDPGYLCSNKQSLDFGHTLSSVQFVANYKYMHDFIKSKEHRNNSEYLSISLLLLAYNYINTKVHSSTSK